MSGRSVWAFTMENNKLNAKYCYAIRSRSVSKVNEYKLAEREFVSKVNSIV